MKLPAIFLVTLLLFPSIQLNASEPQIIAGPYLQNINSTAVTIMWITDEATENNIVRWGSMELENAIDATEGKIHEARIEGLEPSKRYYYAVESDGSKSRIYSFVTTGCRNLSFIVYGDTRGVWDSWRNASIVASAIEKENASFVIHAGDIVRNGGSEKQWITFFQISSWMHNKSMFAAVGNHDLPYSSFSAYLSLPGNERWYSFYEGDVQFIALDSNDASNLTQFLWLMNELSKESKWKIAIFHHPCLISGYHIPSLPLKLWMLLFHLKGVDAVFMGHQHYYQHMKVGKVHYIITGGGGAPLYSAGWSPWNVFSRTAFHYCRVFAGSKLKIAAVSVDGEVMEEFMIS